MRRFRCVRGKVETGGLVCACTQEGGSSVVYFFTVCISPPLQLPFLQVHRTFSLVLKRYLSILLLHKEVHGLKKIVV